MFLERRSDLGEAGILSSLIEDSDSLRFSNFFILLSKPRLTILGDFGCCDLLCPCDSGSESEEIGLKLRTVLGAGIGAFKRPLAKLLPGSISLVTLDGIGERGVVCTWWRGERLLFSA